MLQKLQNLTTAWIITLCVVLVATLLGGRISLLRIRDSAVHAYEGGPEGNFGSIVYDLDEILADSYNLTTVASSYLDDGDVLIESVLSARTALQQAGGPRESHSAALKLRGAIEALDERLTGLELSGSDQAYHNKLAVNIESRFATIENNRYNDAAGAFNREISRLPAGLIATVTGVDELELYA